MNAVQVLMRDHEELKEFFRQFEEAGKRDAKTKQQIVTETIKELEAHMQLEERIFYPAVREKADEDLLQVLLEGIEEHEVAKFVKERLQSGGLEDQTAEAKFKVLMESVRHHLREEEKQLFPEAKRLMAEELDELGAQMEELEKQVEG